MNQPLSRSGGCWHWVQGSIEDERLGASTARVVFILSPDVPSLTTVCRATRLLAPSGGSRASGAVTVLLLPCLASLTLLSDSFRSAVHKDIHSYMEGSADFSSTQTLTVYVCWLG